MNISDILVLPNSTYWEGP